MAQFTVYQNKNLQRRAEVPFLLDVQNDLLSDLETRVVVPLCPLSAIKGKPLRALTPVVEIEAEPHVLLTPQIAGISKSEPGAWVAHLELYRYEIIGAIDFLVTGI